MNINQVVDDFTILDLNDSDDDSDYEPEESDSDSDAEDCFFGKNSEEIEKRVYGAPRDPKYQQTKFLTNVNIQQIMELGSVFTKAYQLSRKDQKNKKLRRVHRNNVVTHAIKFTYEKVMSGEACIRNYDTKDPLLEDASNFELHVSEKLKKGWGRRCRLTECGTYGRKYITKYIDEVKELFNRGNKESSHKMNPAMIREFLAQKYPNTYSLPGETEIK